MGYKVTLAATVPVAQYANVQPSVEGVGETFAEAYADAQTQIRTIWNDFCEKGKELPVGDAPVAVAPKNLVKLTSSVTPGYAMFDEDIHVYYNDKGEKLLSGTGFSSQYKYPFNPSMILPKMVAKWNVEAADIQATWDLKRDAATHFGNALHRALELYGKYAQISAKMEKSALCDMPFLANVVANYYEGRDNEVALYEEFVTDGVHCGQIDRLVVTGDRHCVIRDFKTAPDLHKPGSPKMLKKPFNTLPNTPFGAYSLQLNYYADIVEKAGWTVDGIVIDHWNNGWTEVPVTRMGVLDQVTDEWITAEGGK